MSTGLFENERIDDEMRRNQCNGNGNTKEEEKERTIAIQIAIKQQGAEQSILTTILKRMG